MLQQSLVDEFIKMFGQEILYIPRKLIHKDTILNEEVISQYDDSFLTYAYFENFEGFAGNGDILTKFGIRSTDEITLSLSRQMFQDFIAMQMFGVEGVEVGTRPQEGDLIFFGLTDNLFEIKFVEHEVPFYQFGALYTYQIKCELYEYENETAAGDILQNQENEGFIVKYYYDAASLSGEPVIGEVVIGGTTGISAKINAWNPALRYVELRAPLATAEYDTYQIGETLTGQESGFSINISSFDELDMEDPFASNIEFETEGDNILDFTERNPFGEFGNRS